MTNLCLVVALTWYWECAGEPVAGQRAVQDVTWTRAVEKAWKAKRNITPMDLFDVLMAPKQFSAVRVLLDKPAGSGVPQDAVFHALMRQADHMMFCAATGESDRWKVTTKATHYWAYKQCSPAWAKEGKDVVTIGNHRFCRL